MPDTRFSWRGLREHLRKYLWVYLAGIALCLVGTSLLWTTTRPRPENCETVNVYMADAYSNPDPLSPVAAKMLEACKPGDEALKEVSFESLMYTENDYNSSILLMTRLTVGEVDAFFACQAAMDALVSSDILVRLDEYVDNGWLAEYGLEPFYATLEDDETGARETFLAGLKLDGVTALGQMGAFNNQGAYLCVTQNGENIETTMKALEVMMAELMAWQPEVDDAGTKAS